MIHDSKHDHPLRTRTQKEGWLLACALGLLIGCAGATTQPSQNTSDGPVIIANQIAHPLSTPLNNTIGGYLEYLPADYEANDKNHPLLIFLHGSGQVGDGSIAGLSGLPCTGLPQFIKDQKFPSEFHTKGESFSFIVVSPQFRRWGYASDVLALINHLKERGLRYDPKRVYLTGLSMGGGTVWAAAGNTELQPQIAAIVPICGAQEPNPTTAQAISNVHLPVWAFHNQGDPSVQVLLTQKWIEFINACDPAIPPRMTIFPTSGHDAWSQAYDPTYRESINGQPMNIYEWMLSYSLP